jgi:hypothetical protein
MKFFSSITVDNKFEETKLRSKNVDLPSCLAWGRTAALHELEVASFGLIQLRRNCCFLRDARLERRSGDRRSLSFLQWGTNRVAPLHWVHEKGGSNNVYRSASVVPAAEEPMLYVQNRSIAEVTKQTCNPAEVPGLMSIR